MKFWILMVILDLIVPFVMIGFGWYLLNSKIGIKKIFGYKTVMMMKNMDTENLLIISVCTYYFLVGLIVMPISIIVIIFVIFDTIGTVALIGGMILTLQGLLSAGAPLVVEIAFRKIFDKNGLRR